MKGESPPAPAQRTTQACGLGPVGWTFECCLKVLEVWEATDKT